MAKKEFFDAQTDLTASKILIYREYLSSYLPKVLMQYGKCYIADFFCGPGKNGDKDGSPLVLLEVAKKMLESPILIRKQPNAEVVIVFSDENKSHCDNLSSLLSRMTLPTGIKIKGLFCEDFNSIKTRTLRYLQGVVEPKFFFLDPFTYSEIGIDDIKTLMNISRTEVLLFLPTIDSYRFASCAEKTGALKNFVENFTERGFSDYEDINDFNESIRRKLLSYISLKYVRAIGLEEGKRKHALFYLTKHPIGMMVMNKLVWKFARDGRIVESKRGDPSALFDLSVCTSNFTKTQEAFQKHLREKKRISNREIIDFAVQSGLDTKYVDDILREMKNKDLLM